MFKVLRIISCIIAAVCCAACVFVFIYAGVVWGICTLLGAVVFFVLTILFKRLQEDGEKKVSQPADSPTPSDDNGQV
ncbi:MAG: hypothetical protein ACI4QI_00590 [Candidatus Coproplasma sp.]